MCEVCSNFAIKKTDHFIVTLEEISHEFWRTEITFGELLI